MQKAAAENEGRKDLNDRSNDNGVSELGKDPIIDAFRLNTPLVESIFLLLSFKITKLIFYNLSFVCKVRKQTKKTISKKDKKSPQISMKANGRRPPCVSSDLLFFCLPLVSDYLTDQHTKPFGQTFIANDFFLSTIGVGHLKDLLSYKVSQCACGCVFSGLMDGRTDRLCFSFHRSLLMHSSRISNQSSMSNTLSPLVREIVSTFLQLLSMQAR